MPKFNIYQQQSDAASRRASADSFGAAQGAAMQNFGKSLGQFSEVAQKKVDYDELVVAKKTASSLFIKNKKELSDYKSGAAFDGDGLVNTVIEGTDSQWDDAIAGVSGKPAREYLNQRKQSTREYMAGQAIAEQTRLKGKSIADGELRTATYEATSVYDDPELLDYHIANTADRVSTLTVDEKAGTGYWSKTDASAYQNEQVENLYYNAGLGTVAKLDSLASAESFLEELSTDEWKNGLTDPHYRTVVNATDRRMTQLENEATALSSASNNAIKRQVKDNIAALQSGNIVSRAENLTSESIIGAYGSDADLGQRTLRSLERAEKLAPEINLVATADAATAAQLMMNSKNNLGSGSSKDFSDRAESHNILSNAYAVRNKAVQEKPAEYALRNSDSLRESYASVVDEDGQIDAEASIEFRNQLVAEQQRLGTRAVNTQALLPSETQYYRDRFDKALITQGEDLYPLILSLEESTGHHYGAAIRDLVEAGIPQGLAYVAGMTNPTDAAEAAQAVKDYKINKDNISGDSSIAASDYAVTNSTLRPYLDTIPSVGGAVEAEELGKTVEALTLSHIANGKYSPSKAKQKAYDAVIGNRYEIDGSLRVPVSVGKSAGMVKNQLTATFKGFRGDYSESVDWERIRSMGTDNQDDIKESVIRSIETGNMSYRAAADDSGVVLVSETGAPLYNKQGDHFIIPWSDLNTEANPNATGADAMRAGFPFGRTAP